jgi:pyruvate dehydrogenase E1 component alpha subunit
LKRARKSLIESAVADEGELQAVDQEVERLIDQAVEFAEKSPEPSPDSIDEHVF